MPEIGDHKVVREVKPVSKADMAIIMEDIIEQVKEARDGGQTEYARDKDNAFANFETELDKGTYYAIISTRRCNRKNNRCYNILMFVMGHGRS